MSNAKAVVLKIDSKIKMIGQEDQDMELMTEGKFYIKEGQFYFTYEESELSGMEGTRTLLKLGEERVTMRRFGQNDSELTFEAGIRYDALYKTPYGNFDMEVVASKVDFQVDEEGNADIELIYEISIRGLGENKTYMKIKAKPAGVNS